MGDRDVCYSLLYYPSGFLQGLVMSPLFFVGHVGDDDMRSLRLSLRLSLELFVGDVERDTEVVARLAPELSIGGLGGSVQCSSYTVFKGIRVCSVYFSPRAAAAVRDKGKRFACSNSGTAARLAPELSVGEVKINVWSLSYHILRSVEVLIVCLVLRATAFSQVTFEGDALSPPE